MDIKAAFKMACGCTGLIACGAAAVGGCVFLISMGTGWHLVLLPAVIFCGYFLAHLVLDWSTD